MPDLRRPGGETRGRLPGQNRHIGVRNETGPAAEGRNLFRLRLAKLAAGKAAGDKQAVQAVIARALDIGLKPVADRQNPPRPAKQSAGAVINWPVRLAKIIDPAPKTFIKPGKRPGAGDRLLAPHNLNIGIGADHGKIARARARQHGAVIFCALVHIIAQAGAQNERGLVKIAAGKRRAGKQGAVAVRAQMMAHGAINAPVQSRTHRIARRDDSVISLRRNPNLRQLLPDHPGRPGRVGEQDNFSAPGAETGESLAGRRKRAGPVMKHTPDIAQDAGIRPGGLAQTPPAPWARLRPGAARLITARRGHRLPLTIARNKFRFPGMKKNLHPDYHDITVVLTDKTSFRTRSTYGKAGERLVLDIDPATHPAWTGGGQHLVDRGGQLSKFNKRYRDFNLKAGSGGGTGAS